MFDLQAAVREAFDKAKDSGAIDKAINKTIQSTIADIVSRELGTYSDFGKMVEEKVKQSLELHGRLELPAYSTFVMECVRRHLGAAIDTQLGPQLTKNLERMLGTPPKSIKLSELVESYRKQHDDRDHDREGVDISVEWRRSDYGSGFLTLKKNGDKYDRDECRFSFTSPDWRDKNPKELECFIVELGGAEKTLGCRCSEFERLAFAMRIAGTKLIVDREDF